MASLESFRASECARHRPGVCLDASGADFALYSEHAKAVFVVLFDGEASRSFALQREGNLWSVRIEGAVAGLRYGYRVESTAEPGDKPTDALLLDPYAVEFSGSYDRNSNEGACGLFGVLAESDDFDWGEDEHPNTPLASSVLYETHVKGATKLLFSIPSQERGTYEALASEAFIDHVKAIGATALDLLPIHEYLDEDRLTAKGLRNYWGYNTIGYFAPSRRYAKDPKNARHEFRAMVKKLHAAKLEVILDVVYNHTAETDETGPTLSFRGIDNRTYYRLPWENPALYVNYTGCGNTVNAAHPAVLDFILDSLRWWVEEMHVDGFRFDLAATLTRESRFLEAVKADPVLKCVKLIAEPWDIGPDGYRLGRFNAPWSEWNDHFRDDVRGFWLTHTAGVGALAQRLCASSEIFRYAGRRPQASLNFITAHDGFTLADLVSYSHKHNEANGEENRDGTDRNLSINCGAEGETDNPDIIKKRRLLRRALLATLMLSQGVPMLLAGDGSAHSQGGNNNAYCQDNTTTWLSWNTAGIEDDSEFVGKLSSIRARFLQLTNTEWLTGSAVGADRDVVWLTDKAQEMRQSDWTPQADVLGMLLGRQGKDGRLLLYFYRTETPQRLSLPEGEWTRILQSELENPAEETLCEESIDVKGPGVAVLCETSRGFRRQGGFIAHVTSLPGRFGSGDFGKEAHAFVDWLGKAKQSLWQVLPLTVAGEGNSPYMGESVLAGNELLIDLEELVSCGWLLASELVLESPFSEDRTDFPRVTAFRMDRLKRAAFRFFSAKDWPPSYSEFLEKERAWLADYALFRSLQTEQQCFGRRRWQDWPDELKRRDPEALAAAEERLKPSIQFWCFAQWCFQRQFCALRDKAHRTGIDIIGDIPIFVSPQSADVWSHPELFQLDKEGNPTAVAGVPPDYFSPTGQLWGNPLYDWKAHEKEGYAWWNARLKRAADLYDVLRIDHFRGFEAFWSVPAGSETALDGHWEKGPGRAPFETVLRECPTLRFIAEDLGTITPEVNALRRSLGFPGMRVLQFAFSGRADNPHLPSNVTENTAYYPGTHDNDTILGWFSSLDDRVKQQVRALLGETGSVSLCALEVVLASRARYAVALIQDALELPGEARMNRPGDATGSWGWRIAPGALTESLALKLAQLSAKYARNT